MRCESSVVDYVDRICRRAGAARRVVSLANPERKELALRRMAETVRARSPEVLEANRRDLAAGLRLGLSEAFLDRLRLTKESVERMAAGLEEIAAMRDPVGEVVAQWRRPGGFEVGQVRIPLGVIAVIYESRPEVTVNAAGLCFKAGNVVLLRGGSEALHSNLALASAVRAALESAGLPADSVQLVETPDREAVTALLRRSDFVDLVIPRGGKSLIELVVRESTIPVIKHYEGICHVYVHGEADLEMALRIAVNGKTQRPGTCNAMETLLVDQAVAAEFLPRLADEFGRLGVAIHGCPATSGRIRVAAEATAEHYRTEYLALVCNVRVVSGFEEAVEHIETYGSNHTDVIVTTSFDAARRFVAVIDSSSVMVNASPRLADGGVYGLGAEIGISTDKLHAYGPMGLGELTTKKFVVFGDGHLRE